MGWRKIKAGCDLAKEVSHRGEVSTLSRDLPKRLERCSQCESTFLQLPVPVQQERLQTPRSLLTFGERKGKRDMSMVFLSNLPKDLLVHIALFLADSCEGISNFAAVSSCFSFLAREEYIWYQLITESLCHSQRLEEKARLFSQPSLFVDIKPKLSLPRVRTSISGSLWREIAECATDESLYTPLNFRGFFTDGGHDMSMSGADMRRRHWAGNMFRPDRKSFYCSQRRENILACAVLVQGEELDCETSADRFEVMRRQAVLSCLKGSYYDISNRPHVLHRASTAELEKIFVDIVANPTGLELLVSAKFGLFKFPSLFGTSRSSRDSYRQGLRALAAKIAAERQTVHERDLQAISEGSRYGCRLLFEGIHALDYQEYRVASPGVIKDFCAGISNNSFDDYALIHKLKVKREGNFTCPVSCAAIFIANDILHCSKEFAASGTTEHFPTVVADHKLAMAVDEDMANLDHRHSMLKLINSANTVTKIETLVRNRDLPPIRRMEFLADGVETIEFEPLVEVTSGLQLVAWFRFPRGNRRTSLEIPLSCSRYARFLLAKLITSEDRMASTELDFDSPNIDCSGIYAYGQVLRVSKEKL